MPNDRAIFQDEQGRGWLVEIQYGHPAPTELGIYAARFTCPEDSRGAGAGRLPRDRRGGVGRRGRAPRGARRVGSRARRSAERLRMGSSSPAELHLGPEAAELVRREIRRARGNEVCFLAGGGRERRAGGAPGGRAGARLGRARGDPRPGRRRSWCCTTTPRERWSPPTPIFRWRRALWDAGPGLRDHRQRRRPSSTSWWSRPRPSGSTRWTWTRWSADLGPGGPVARAHPGYEDRPQQRALARMIAALYNEGGVGIAEAGTGHGQVGRLPAPRHPLGAAEPRADGGVDEHHQPAGAARREGPALPAARPRGARSASRW